MSDVEREAAPIIRTKLNRPGLSARLVVRPRLLERLVEGIERRVTLISAPGATARRPWRSSV